jgi:hypothetical protein
MKNWVLGLTYGTGVITHEGNTLVGHSVISHDMHYPENLGAIASSSYILDLCGGLCNRRLFVRRPTNKRRSKKVTCTRSVFRSIPQPAKSASEKPTRSSNEEAKYQLLNLSVYLRYLKIR